MTPIKASQNHHKQNCKHCAKLSEPTYLLADKHPRRIILPLEVAVPFNSSSQTLSVQWRNT